MMKKRGLIPSINNSFKRNDTDQKIGKLQKKINNSSKEPVGWFGSVFDWEWLQNPPNGTSATM